MIPRIQWATPPTGASSDSDGPIRFRKLSDLLDNTDEVEGYEYSGLCFLAADEPTSVEHALEEYCWKDAMKAKLQSIKENNTWTLTELPKG